MRKNIKILILIIAFIIINFMNNNRVYGAIAFKDTTTALTGHTISEFYDMVKEMNGNTGSLAGTSVDVHMANNREWATVSYFSNSSYGTSGAGQNTGTTIGSHYSTNGNITGVMDWGKKTTFTSGVIDNYPTSGGIYNNGKSLIEGLRTNLQIDEITKLNAEQLGRNTWYTNWNWDILDNNIDYPYSVRNGLFSFAGGTNKAYLAGEKTSGKAGEVTFRAVFYN